MKAASNPADQSIVPPPQHNFRDAAALALAAIRRQPAEQLEWLGATPAGNAWTLRVLEDLLTLELDGGAVRTSIGCAVGHWWRILTFHYLAVSSRPKEASPALSFADLTAGRSYEPVYRRRVIDRLCQTIGQRKKTLLRACEAIGGRTAPLGDLAVDFQAYPRVAVRLVWYAGDSELPPSATLLLPENIESFFCPEDIVVLSERLVARLSGGRF
jgi:hypothetical protein